MLLAKMAKSPRKGVWLDIFSAKVLFPEDMKIFIRELSTVIFAHLAKQQVTSNLDLLIEKGYDYSDVIDDCTAFVGHPATPSLFREGFDSCLGFCGRKLGKHGDGLF
jgi:hypothetical protein